MKETRKYKQTELGLLPEDWEVAKLRKKFRFISNNTFSRDFLCEDGEIKNIHYGDVLIKYCSTLDVSQSDIPAINSELLPSYQPKCFAEDGDIIIADTAEDETVCKATELWNIGEKLVVSGLHTMWCRPEQNTFAIKFLGYFMNTSLYHNQVLPLIQGIKVASVSKNAIQGTWLCIPPIEEQCRIASALTSIDNLLDSLDRLISKKRDIKHGTMQQLLFGKKRLKGFTEPWVEKKLGDVAETASGGTPSRSNIDYYKGRICWFTTSELTDNYLHDSNEHITNEALLCSSAKLFPSGTLLIAMYGATIGRLGVLCTVAATNQACCAINCQKIDTIFLFHLLLLNRPNIIELGCGAGQPNISQDIVRSLELLVPSSLSEQQAIASVLTSMDNELSALEAKRKKYEQIKQGMMQQLLTGKIRLIS